MPAFTDFKALYSQYADYVRSIAYKVVGANLVDDVVQESFVKIWKAQQQFQGDSSLKTWIGRIALNTAVDVYRQKKLDVSLETSPEPETLPENKDAQEEIMQALSLIPLDFRAVLVAVIFEELNTKEVAVSLNIPEGTVKSRLSRGREMLQIELKKRGYDYA